MFRELHKELKNLERKKRRAEMFEIEQELNYSFRKKNVYFHIFLLGLFSLTKVFYLFYLHGHFPNEKIVF